MNTFFYCLRQGFKNFVKNPLFSIASTATVAACIFLFCMFLGLVANITQIALKAEANVGITVFFAENATEEEKAELKKKIENYGHVREIRYISSDEAWESFQKDYFGDKAEELAAAFADDNPLSESDSYEIFMNSVDEQPGMVEFLSGDPLVREINYANTLVAALNKMNRGIYALSAVIIGVLFCVSVFLISNTIHVAAAFRKRENQIMRLIGATSFMIKAPFVVEGMMIGTLGALIPLGSVWYIYTRATEYIGKQVAQVSGSGSLREVVALIPVDTIFPQMVAVGLILGVGMGFVVSSVTINKHLRV